MKIYRLIALFFPILLFSACTGSAYKLPAVSQAETIQKQAEVDADETPIKTFKRSDAYYKKQLAAITKRLTKSAQPLCKSSEYDPCYFEVTYSNDTLINAYAHENYKITVFKGLLDYLETNDEMAAVVAHEMGHHLAHHNEETAQNAAAGAAISGLVTAILIGAANANNPYYNSYQQQQDQETMQNMMAAGAKIGAISYSKEQEREADLLGAYLVKYAGYDLKKAERLLYVFTKIDGEEAAHMGNAKAAILDTHPPSSERVVAWEKTIQEIKGNKAGIPYLKETK
ncbi:MAG: M48 family metallopeptidase [Pseudobdellovibrionaceae bacterium]